MLVIGVDAHQRSHTAVLVDDNGRGRRRKLLVLQPRSTCGC